LRGNVRFVDWPDWLLVGAVVILAGSLIYAIFL
jgi:hypothetical protein